MTARPAPGGPAEQSAPRHVAIIMDGNGRWATARRLPRAAGHKAGADAVRRAVETAPRIGIEVLTLYAFSSENWKRPEEEVGYLFGLLKQYLRSEIAELDQNNVRLQLIGDWRALPADAVSLLESALERLSGNTGLTLVIALNYGARDELVRAARRLAERSRDGELDPADIDEDVLAAELFTARLPDPDLVIRTSGEERLSNFLLWQAAYSELVFTPVLWPDFGAEDLRQACAEFTARERRYGGL
ncbi:di-trans,poly-cis-decaprenylcistransferase [Pacificimonas flava]|uniref:Isoprenyl transferase n=2 Tax=Pacificimonas TaxID=1960290 RepID=A0A219B6Y1_9SPHN|nr:di-trans,poly-cis-decaprenylcistransferase [Pacificimonas flava]